MPAGNGALIGPLHALVFLAELVMLAALAEAGARLATALSGRGSA